MSYTVLPVLPEMWGWLGWLHQRTYVSLSSDWRAIAALDSKGAIQGMVMYCNWTGNAVWAHMAADTVGAISALIGPKYDAPVFRYPFIDERKEWLLGALRESNAKALKIDLKLGFKEFARIPDGFVRGEDLILVRMHRDECVWITGKGKRSRAMLSEEISEDRNRVPWHETAQTALLEVT